MSADNYLLIQQEKDGKYRAYNRMCEDTSAVKHVIFEADTLEEAVIKGNEEMQYEVYEYGYHITPLSE